MTTICIDGHNLSLSTGSGIATYARTLIQGIRDLDGQAQLLHGPLMDIPRSPLLREISVGDAKLRAKALRPQLPSRHLQVLLAPFGRTAHFVKPGGEVLWPDHAATPPADGFWLSENLFRIASRSFSNSRRLTPVNFAKEAGSRSPDIMHWTYPAPLYGRAVPNIYTLHDLIPLKLPHATLDDKRRYLDLCRTIVDRADHIITVSDTTRADVISMLGVGEDKVTTTWQPADLPAGILSRTDAIVAAELDDVLALEWGKYFIFFGAIEPKKNLARIVEAYLRSGTRMPLVVVGGRAWLDEAETGYLDEVIATNGAAGQRLRRFDYLPRSTLFDLVRGARATLFPSLYEGFGLPVLESMMLGTPVLASRAGSLPEIAGDAALMVDPYDLEDMARGIRDLAGDDGLCAELTKRGLIRAARFSAEAYRVRLKEVYSRFVSL
jgi:glycosyltransferase involved in cell wall biosynthesis